MPIISMTESEGKKSPGRKKKYATEEERKQAKNIQSRESWKRNRDAYLEKKKSVYQEKKRKMSE